MRVFKIFHKRGVLEALKLEQGQESTERVFPYASSWKECKTKNQHKKSSVLKRKRHTCLIDMRRMDREQEEQTTAGEPASPSGHWHKLGDKHGTKEDKGQDGGWLGQFQITLVPCHTKLRPG